jgi:hypothetical protein
MGKRDKAGETRGMICWSAQALELPSFLEFAGPFAGFLSGSLLGGVAHGGVLGAGGRVGGGVELGASGDLEDVLDRLRDPRPLRAAAASQPLWPHRPRHRQRIPWTVRG